MARTYTLTELRTLCFQRADMENTSFASTTEINHYINSSIAELHDILTESFQDYHLSSTIIQVAGSQDVYDLPADFYKILRVEADRTSNFASPYPLQSFSMPEWNRNQTAIIGNTSGLTSRYRILGNYIFFEPKPSGSGYVRLWYYPPAKKLDSTTRTFTDSDVSVANDTISYTAHGYRCGDRVSFTNSGGALPTGITSATNYFAIPASKDTFKIATSPQNAFDGVAVDITAASGGGTNTINDDSALFDGVNGWEEYVICDVAAKLREKEQNESAAILQRKADVYARIKAAAKSRDVGQSPRIIDVTATVEPYWYSGGHIF